MCIYVGESLIHVFPSQWSGHTYPLQKESYDWSWGGRTFWPTFVCVNNFIKKKKVFFFQNYLSDIEMIAVGSRWGHISSTPKMDWILLVTHICFCLYVCLLVCFCCGCLHFIRMSDFVSQNLFQQSFIYKWKGNTSLN